MLKRARLFAIALLAVLLATAPVVVATGCKGDPEAYKASLEGEIKTDIDQIELKAASLPNKTDVMAKVAEFKKELDSVKGDEAKLRKLRDRVDTYAQQVAQMTGGMGVAPVTPPVGSKLPPGQNTGGTGMGGTGTGMGGTGGTMGGTGGTMGGTGGTMGGTGGTMGGTGGTMGGTGMGGTGGTMGGTPPAGGKLGGK